MTECWPVRMAPLGSLGLGARLWMWGDIPHVTLHAKATFRGLRRGSLRASAPRPLCVADRFDSRGALINPVEVTPPLSRVDVYATGRAYVVGGAQISLSVYRRGATLFERRVDVCPADDAPSVVLHGQAG
ncbi:MAG: hypothetical protein AAGA56_24175, partial [Myxococcota bacterium]